MHLGERAQRRCFSKGGANRFLIQDFSYLPGLPNLNGCNEAALSFMFYDTDQRLGEHWIEWIDKMFGRFDETPSQSIFNAPSGTRRGSYKRQKKALVSALRNTEISGNFDVRVRSSKPTNDLGFFPSSMEVILSSRGGLLTRGSVSVLAKHTSLGLYETAVSIGSSLHEVSGTFYGHASYFPAVLGPEQYLANVGSIPKGWSFESTRAFTKRITNWRNNFVQLDSIGNGFREVFPVNFLKRSHLEKKIAGKSAVLWLQRFGTVEQLAETPDLIVWNLSQKRIRPARTELEKLGLILSA